MGKVFLDITTSLDGFVAGPNDGLELPLGEGGERLHEWVYGLASWREAHGLEGGEVNRDSEIVEETVERTGAVVLGRRMFENAKGWGDEPPFHVPVFVLTHEPREPLAKNRECSRSGQAGRRGQGCQRGRRRQYRPAVPQGRTHRRDADSHCASVPRWRAPALRRPGPRDRGGGHAGRRVPHGHASEVPDREVRGADRLTSATRPH
jgi:hypothetical protein